MFVYSFSFYDLVMGHRCVLVHACADMFMLICICVKAKGQYQVSSMITLHLYLSIISIYHLLSIYHLSIISIYHLSIISIYHLLSIYHLSYLSIYHLLSIYLSIYYLSFFFEVLSLMDPADLLWREASDPPVSASSVPGLQVQRPCLALYTSTGDPNSGSQAPL